MTPEIFRDGFFTCLTLRTLSDPQICDTACHTDRRRFDKPYQQVCHLTPFVREPRNALLGFRRSVLTTPNKDGGIVVVVGEHRSDIEYLPVSVMEAMVQLDHDIRRRKHLHLHTAAEKIHPQAFPTQQQTTPSSQLAAMAKQRRVRICFAGA